MAAVATSLDTLVVDDPDAPTTEARTGKFAGPAVSRTSTDGALTMQVLHAGAWHRRTPDLQRTACGERFHSQFAPVRREELCHPLCPTCFTAYETACADALAAKEGTDP